VADRRVSYRGISGGRLAGYLLTGLRHVPKGGLMVSQTPDTPAPDTSDPGTSDGPVEVEPDADVPNIGTLVTDAEEFADPPPAPPDQPGST
jgi:hypothetical protein